MDFRTILEGMIQEKLSSKNENFEALEVLLRNYEKNPHHGILCQFFSPVVNNKLR